MKFILLIMLVSGCTNQSANLNHRILKDSDGCEYIVQTGVGDTVFLSQNRDVKCKANQ